MGVRNQDGSPRKKGSGRPKGAISFIKIRRAYLEHLAQPDELVPVSRVWLEKKKKHPSEPK